MRSANATFRNGQIELREQVDWPEGIAVEVTPIHDLANSATLPTEWPEGYFQQTAGALEGEPMQRPPQGDLPARENW